MRGTLNMNNLVTQTSELIYKMDNEQLAQVIEAVQLRRQYLTKQATRSLNVGDNVQFTSSKTGKVKQGTVTKIARKYITIDCGPFDSWRVPGNMIEKV
jgi:putative ribosome biogenesis GTPase RsgA